MLLIPRALLVCCLHDSFFVMRKSHCCAGPTLLQGAEITFARSFEFLVGSNDNIVTIIEHRLSFNVVSCSEHQHLAFEMKFEKQWCSGNAVHAGVKQF